MLTVIPGLEGKCLSQNRLGRSALKPNLEISVAYCRKRFCSSYKRDASISPTQLFSNNAQGLRPLPSCCGSSMNFPEQRNRALGKSHCSFTLRPRSDSYHLCLSSLAGLVIRPSVTTRVSLLCAREKEKE